MKCCICNNEIEGYPNNAEPIKSGQCCTNCNLEIVIPNRLKHMNALRKAAIAQATFEKGMMELNGYEVQTTFYQDFTIADAFGVDAVETLPDSLKIFRKRISTTFGKCAICNKICTN